MSELPETIQDGLDAEGIGALMIERFGLEPDPQATVGGTSYLVPRERLLEVIDVLRGEDHLRFDTLLDVTAVDYLAYPGWRHERYAVVYILRSMHFRHRLRLKVLVEEGDETMPTISDRYRIADWLEREVYDQYGIRFEGHPNLKRILNHHEFVGHPLRKDYPVQKRQHLSINDPMLDELSAILERRGYEIIDHETTSPEGVDPRDRMTAGVSSEGAA